MSDVLTGIEVLLFLICLVAAIPYLIWLGYSAWKRRWRRVVIQVVCPVVGYFVVIAFLNVFHARSYREYLNGIYDAQVSFDRPIFTYDSPRAFNGDGYSIEVYSLPDDLKRRFQNSDSRLLSEFPKRPDVRSRWSVFHWSKAPFDSKQQKYLDFALSEYDAREASELTSHFADIRRALQDSQCFYSFLYFDHQDYPGDVDFFIVDLAGKRVYVINHNT